MRSPPVSVSLGCHVTGVALPKPDLSDSVSLLAGAMKRFLAPPPDDFWAHNSAAQPNGPLSKLSNYVTERVVEKWPVLQSIKPFEVWIEERPYPRKRKDELIKLHAKLVQPDVFPMEYFPRKVKEHMKDEPYPEYKYPRPINAAEDDWKVLLGPIFSSMEDTVFSDPTFIKHIPIAARPRYIRDRLGEVRRAATADFSSFEASFRKEIMESVEFPVYRHFLSLLPDYYFRLLCRLYNVQFIENKHYAICCLARRMSGEMNTSLANGLSNYFLQEYVCLVVCKNEWMRGVFEGDDGLFVVSHSYPKPEDYSVLGFTIKLEIFDTLEEASFCGLIFDPVELANITDPRECITTFGWTTREYLFARQSKLDMLLVAKAYSYLAQYPGAPVLQPLAMWILSVVKHDKEAVYEFVRDKMCTSMWERSQILDALRSSPLPREIGLKTRLLMAKKFNFTIDQQLDIERWFSLQTTVCPIPGSLIGILHPDCADYYKKYVREVEVGREAVHAFIINYPVGLPSVPSDFVYQTPVSHAKVHSPKV